MQILEYAGRCAAEAAELTRRMAVIPAPSHGEERRAEFCLEWMKENLGGNCYVDDALNAVCELGDPSKPQVLLMAHTDIVFGPEIPLEITERDGRMYCPGVGDDTANLAVLLIAARFVKDRLPKEVGLIIAANACEEGLGNLKGCRALMERYGSRLREMISFDGYMGGLTDAAVGSERYRVCVDVEGGHSYARFGADNAIAVMAEIIGALNRQTVPAEGKTTFNFGTIAGGTTVNSICAHCEMLYEFRSDVADHLDAMRANFDETIGRFAQRYAVTAELLGRRPCGRGVDPEKQEALCRRIDEAFRGIAKQNCGPSSTDCNLPLSMGIPAVSPGFVDGGGAHTVNEYIVTDSLFRGLTAAVRLLVSYE